jgi:hypothetical protein
MHAVPGMRGNAHGASEGTRKGGTENNRCLSVGQCSESSGICVPLANLKQYVYI